MLPVFWRSLRLSASSRATSLKNDNVDKFLRIWNWREKCHQNYSFLTTNEWISSSNIFGLKLTRVGNASTIFSAPSRSGGGAFINESLLNLCSVWNGPCASILPLLNRTTCWTFRRYCNWCVTRTQILLAKNPLMHLSKMCFPTCVSMADSGSSSR